MKEEGSRSTTQSMHRVSWLMSSGSTFGNMPHPQLVAAECGRARCRPPRWPAALAAIALASTTGEVDRGHHWRAVLRIGHERYRVRRLLRPGVDPFGRVGRAPDAKVSPPCSLSHVSWVQQVERGDGGVLRVWFCRELVDRGGQAQALRDPAVGGRDPLGPLDRGGGQQGQPQPAVGAEALLRSEVVRVGRGDVQRGAPSGRGAVDQYQGAVVRSGDPPYRGAARRWRSRCAPRRTRRRPASPRAG